MDSSTILRVALVGNPNTGKSTLFSGLVGIRQHVANYPGVTVEKKTGRMDHAGRRYVLIDLPGLYSLSPRSRDEVVAVDVLMGRCGGLPPVDAAICIVDAVNLRRNLYLVSQVLELGLPTVLAVNMVDVAARRGVRLDLTRIAERMGVQVVAVQANRRIGLAELRAALTEAIQQPRLSRESPFPAEFEREVAELETWLATSGLSESQATPLSRSVARRLLLDVGGQHRNHCCAGRGSCCKSRSLMKSDDGLHAALAPDGDGRLAAYLAAARARLAESRCPVPGIETASRHAWARRVLDGAVSEPNRAGPTLTDRIDRWLTHRLWGTLIFAVVMVAVFQAVFVGASPAMRLIDHLCAAAGSWLEAHLAEGALRSLLVGGVLGGVGGVLSFLPQILILFFFIGILEDCGYMARAAYLMDRLMARVGLSGKSFIPMLCCFACAVPGIMATRVIEDERDRLSTILAAPLLTCSARLPVYALMIAAFIPPAAVCGGWLGLQGLTLAALYALGIIMAVLTALLLKRTLLRGAAPSFVMELPSYKWPAGLTVLHRVVQRGWIFVRFAGTLILAIAILVWAALYYPHNAASVAPLKARQAEVQAALDRTGPDDPQRPQLDGQLAELQREIEGEYQRHSILGRLGRLIEPVVRPLGWDWRIGCAVLASLPAREVVVATMGVMFDAPADVDLSSEAGATQMRAKLRSATRDGTGEPLLNLPIALSIMVFIALCAQCGATLAVMKRETGSWKWPALAFTYMTALAYCGALATYQVGMWISG